MIPYNLNLFSPLIIQIFTSIFVSPLFISSQQQLPQITYDCSQTFDNYLFTYNKTYNYDEYEYRKSIFYTNLEYINSRNTENLTYTLGINNFTDLTTTEFSKMYKGYRGIPNYHLPIQHSLSNESFRSIDWRAEGLVTNIKDQAQCGSCWAFSAVATMEGAQAKKSGNLTSLSEQDLVDCVPDCYGCDGGWPSSAILYVINGTLVNNTNIIYGNDTNLSMIDTETSYSYEATDGTCLYNVSNRGANITDIIGIPKGSDDLLQDALISVGPLSVAIDAEDDFQFYKSGIFSSDSCSNTQLDHAVTAVGLGITSDGRKYYIIKNSWGTSWGEDGYIYYSADIPNMCGIAQDACYAT